jgi:hypothetical protein
MRQHSRQLGDPLAFDPLAGITIREPLGEGPGFWAGAPSALFEAESGRYYLYYRMRKPRELGRGVDCRIAVSDDGLAFEDIWRATREQIGTQSMEKSCLYRTGEGLWRLYLSFVGEDGRWRIEMTEAASPDAFDVGHRTPILDADDCGAEGVKDPAIYEFNGLLHMIVSYAPRPRAADPQTEAIMHATGDIYNTGVTKSHTGLATSVDGIRWTWEGDILSPPADGWDSYCTRIGSVLAVPHAFVGLYDGSADVSENYEEKAGICMSADMRHWRRLTSAGPFVLSPHSSRTIRYIEAVQAERAIYYYYEFARPDGSHELRGNRVALP